MVTKTRHYQSSFTLDDLVTTCNTDENDIGGQLQSLEAVKDTNGKKVTEAIYDKSRKTNLGNLTIKKASAGPGTAFDGDAFILTVRTDVSVFRTAE